MFTSVNVAAISFRPEKFNLAANCDLLEATFRRAAKGGAQLAVAPEGVLEGYVVNEIIAGKAEASQMNDVAITMKGPEMRRFRALASELKMSLAFGSAYFRPMSMRPNRPLRRLGGPHQARLSH